MLLFLTLLYNITVVFVLNFITLIVNRETKKVFAIDLFKLLK